MLGKANDKWNTTFVTNSGPYKYLVMLYGLYMSREQHGKYTGKAAHFCLIKEQQHFLGFAYFYTCFNIFWILRVWHPCYLTFLKGCLCTLNWNEKAQQVSKPCTRPLSLHLFWIGMAVHCGNRCHWGNVLSQHHRKATTMYTISYFPRKSSYAGQNYEEQY